MSEPGAAISHPEPKHVDIEVPVSNINAQARILDLELRKLEVQEANDHLQIAKASVAFNFSSSSDKKKLYVELSP